jgi:hypothetical protein
MKDILITAKRQKRELRWLCAALATAFLLNVYAIATHHTEWKELWTQLVWVICIGLGLYVLSVGLRCIGCGVARLFRKR